MKIHEIFEAVSKVSSKTEKERILSENKSELLDLILEDTYRADKYNVKKFQVQKTGNMLTIDENYDVFHHLLRDLALRILTGDAARYEVGNTIGQFVPEDQIWLERILNKNLKIGAGNTFSKDSGVVQKYPCALANVLEKVKNVDVLDGNWFVSRKLDGVRCHAHVTVDNDCNVRVEYYSRQGKLFETLNNLDIAFEQLFRTRPNSHWVVDGEVCIIDDNGHENFQGLMSLVRRKDYTIEHPRFNAFDILTLDEFWGHAKSPKFSERLQRLHDLYNEATNGSSQDINRVFDILQQERLTTRDQFDRWMDKRIAGDWEGLMVRKDVPYEGKRSNNLLKIKPMKDDEYVVTGLIEGDLTYNTTNGSEVIHGVSALTITHKGNQVKVGSGLSKDQRLRWIEHPEEIIGKTITVKYFEETQDAKTGEYSLRFPTLVYVYDGERDI